MARKRHVEAEESDERWLLTYADMITLLMALFMVLFSISSVNTSKYEGLQRSLKDAFSGRVLPGGTSVAAAGGQATSSKALAPPLAALVDPIKGAAKTARQGAETKQFEKLKARIDRYAQVHGISGQVKTEVTRDGLRIRLLTDKLLFDSGSALPKSEAAGLLGKVGAVLAPTGSRPIQVSGHTDNIPIASSQFPTNWELSTARASAVVRVLAGDGIKPYRLTATGRAQLNPITSNDTAGGRAINRRVEILLPRIEPTA